MEEDRTARRGNCSWKRRDGHLFPSRKEKGSPPGVSAESVWGGGQSGIRKGCAFLPERRMESSIVPCRAGTPEMPLSIFSRR